MPGGEMVRTYLSRGDYFGEIGLLRSIKRIATCTALDAVDVVKVPGSEFNLMLEKFPGVRAQLEPVAEARMAETKGRTAPPGLGLDDFLNQGLFEAQNLLLIDLDNCTRCDACVQACAKAHDGVSRLLRDGLRYDHFLVATACRSCRDPLCMTQCPVGSIRRKENLEIIIEDWCIGCGKCAELCPYGNINMHPLEVIKEVKTEIKSPTPGVPPKVKIEKKKTTAYKANTCDLCTQLSVPSCVYACPHDAAKRVDPQRFFGDALEAQAEILKGSWTPERRYERAPRTDSTDVEIPNPRLQSPKKLSNARKIFGICDLDFGIFPGIWVLEFGISRFRAMRINNWKHFPWFVFVCLATIAACLLYVGNFHPDSDAGRDSFAAVADPNSDRASDRGRHAARTGLRRDLAGDFCFRRAPQSPKKNPALASGDRAAVVARPHLAHVSHDSAHSFAQRFSPGRADDHAAHGALCPRHGERDLRARAPASHAAFDEGATAGRDGLRTDPAHPRPALRRRGENARLVQAGSAEEAGCGRARAESREGGDGGVRGDGFDER